MRSSQILRALNPNEPTPYTSPYTAKKSWPPDFKNLSRIEQFRLERRYRRRTKLKWARPNWTKGVKIAQLGTVAFVTVYGVLFLDWKQENPPFQGIRNAFDSMTGSIWTRTPERFQKREDMDDASPVAQTASK